MEIFDVATDDTLRLTHIASVRSPLFVNAALNDVVEGIGGEFYITEWLPFGYPVAGKKSAALMKEKVEQALFTPINLLKIPLTRVFRCQLNETPQCQVATDSRFVMANGIAISHDRQTVYVNDVTLAKVMVLAREPDGMLKVVSSFPTKHSIDNFEMNAKGWNAIREMFEDTMKSAPNTCRLQ